jgi:hypothetical protein
MPTIPAYGYDLVDSIRKAIDLHPEGITTGKLTEFLNGYLNLNHSKTSSAYKLLKERVRKNALGLGSLKKITVEEGKSEISTKYYIFKPAQ